MIAHKRNFFIGVLLIIILLLGIPLSWKFFIIIVCALILIISSLRISLPSNLPKQFSGNQFFKGREKSVVKDVPIGKTMSDVHVRPIEKPLEHRNIVPPAQVEKIHKLPTKISKIAEPVKKITRTRKKNLPPQ